MGNAPRSCIDNLAFGQLTRAAGSGACGDAGLHHRCPTTTLQGSQSVHEAGQLFSCAAQAVVVDQEMLGNRLPLHPCDSLEALQRLEDGLVRPTAVWAGQREGSTLQCEGPVAPENPEC